MTTAQVAVLLGAVLTLVGYRIGASRVPRSAEGTAATDWSNAAVFAVGVVCWVAGSFALVYYAIVVTPENSMRATAQGLAAMGPVLTFLVMLGQRYNRWGPWYSRMAMRKTALPLAPPGAHRHVLQLVLGFVNRSEGARLVGRSGWWPSRKPCGQQVAEGWLAGVIVFAIVIFPVFQAARVLRLRPVSTGSRPSSESTRYWRVPGSPGKN